MPLSIRGRRIDESGWSLTQLMIALAISAVGIGALIALLGFGQKHAKRGNAVTALQQQTRTTVEWMVRELRESAPQSVMITGEENSAIAFASARNTQADFKQEANGIVDWQQVVVYYLKPNTTDLYRYAAGKTAWNDNFDPTTVIAEGLGERVSESVLKLSFQLYGRMLEVTLETAAESEAGVSMTNALSTHTIMRNQL